MALCLQVIIDSTTPNISLEVFTNVQRGIIFMWCFFSFFLFIITGVRLVAGSIDSEESKYKEGEEKKEESEQSFDQMVIKDQKPT